MTGSVADGVAVVIRPSVAAAVTVVATSLGRLGTAARLFAVLGSRTGSVVCVARFVA